jgi:hypothetical protein
VILITEHQGSAKVTLNDPKLIWSDAARVTEPDSDAITSGTKVDVDEVPIATLSALPALDTSIASISLVSETRHVTFRPVAPSCELVKLPAVNVIAGELLPMLTSIADAEFLTSHCVLVATTAHAASNTSS